MNQRLRLTGGNGKEPFVSLQPPPGRTLTDAVQYETIELFFRSNEIKNNTLLFYAGPAKVRKLENLLMYFINACVLCIYAVILIW